MDHASFLPLVCFVNTSLVFVFYTLYNHKNNEITILSKELQKEVSNRQAERLGRINLQKAIRKDITSDNIHKNGFQYHSIGTIESPFPDRRGTPRQPLLVPAAQGIIRFHKQYIQHEHYAELKEFSHIWVVFVFHDNTNADKLNQNRSNNNTSVNNPDVASSTLNISNHSKNSQNNEFNLSNATTNPIITTTSTVSLPLVNENPFMNIASKVKPPRLNKRVGCLSTRSPHRPNNIGLSVCQVLAVDKDGIYISGIDMVHGTPVLDVKPYIPYDSIPVLLPNNNNNSNNNNNNNNHGSYNNDNHGSYNNDNVATNYLRVPEWIYESPVEQLPVRFTAAVDDELTRMELDHEFNLCNDKTHAMELIQQVLRQDIRSNHQGRGSSNQTKDYINNNKKNSINKETNLQGTDSTSNRQKNDSSDKNNMNISNNNMYTCTLDNMFITFATFNNNNSSSSSKAEITTESPSSSSESYIEVQKIVAVKTNHKLLLDQVLTQF